MAYQAYLDRTATLALMTAKCQREQRLPSFEHLTGRSNARSGPVMSNTMLAHNFQLWRHALGQAGDAQQQRG
jgi:hypothetical protein